MLNRLAIVQDHSRFQDLGYTGTPPPHVLAALNYYDRIAEAESEQGADEYRAKRILAERESVIKKTDHICSRTKTEQEIARYLTEKVLPISEDPYLYKLADAMQNCHQMGFWALHNDGNIISWAVKCECLQLCPHEAAEESRRIQDTKIPLLLKLKKQGFYFQKVTISPRCVPARDPVKDDSLKAISERTRILRKQQTFNMACWINVMYADPEICSTFALQLLEHAKQARPLAPASPYRYLQNRLRREQHRIFKKFEKISELRWPQSLKKRAQLAGIEIDSGGYWKTTARKLKGRVFPQIAGALVTMETPLNYEGCWHPHLNVLYVLRENYIDWELHTRFWGCQCQYSTEAQMYEITANRIRARGGNPDTLEFGQVLEHALKEIVKYPLQTVAEKARKKTGEKNQVCAGWTGGAPGAGIYLSATGEHQAPPLTEWAPEAFLEWWYAQYGFRRTRTYGALYGESEPETEDPTLNLADLRPCGVVRWTAAGVYDVPLPLLHIHIDLIQGDNSDLAMGHSWENSHPPDHGPDLHTWLVDEMRLFDYLHRQDPAN